VLPLTTIIPPATLSVVAGSLAQTNLTVVPTIDWAAIDDTGVPVLQLDENTPPALSRIVDLSSVNMDVVPLLRPAATSSYDLQFAGPTLQCEVANSLQQKAFDYYVKQAQYDKAMSFTTLSTIGSDTNGSLIYSGFVPAFYNQPVIWGWGPPSNFNATLGPSYGNLEKGNSRVLQLWVQLYNQSLVCTAVNASFDLTLQFYNSTQKIIERKVEVVGQIEDADYNVWINYLGVLHALFDTLTGNVTTIDDRSYRLISSSIVSSGLVACDDITSSVMFNSEPWMCRNRSIARGIEDFANNVTIGILSIPAMTKTAIILVTTPTPVIRYAYHRLNLILSYGLALTLSALGVLAGGRSFKSNGVTHRFSFSAIMTTTRSPDLASLCEGQSLGSLPLSRDLKQTKLSFGLLGNAQDEMNPDFMRRAGFGLEHKVGNLATGAKCI
jgi:hypothetical protein